VIAPEIGEIVLALGCPALALYLAVWVGKRWGMDAAVATFLAVLLLLVVWIAYFMP
jgi:hypothetical protein